MTRSSRINTVHRAALVVGAIALMAGAIQPAAALAANVGGGAVTGALSYGATRVPAVGSGNCAPTSFTLTGTSAGFVLNTAIAGYAGTVTITGTGSAACELFSNGGGPLTVTISGTGPLESTLQCTNLTGGWNRFGTAFSAPLGGSCTFNGTFTRPVNLVLTAAWVPPATTSSIAAATYHGTLTFPPA